VTITGDVEGVVVSLSPAPELAGQVRVAEEAAEVKLQGVRLSFIQIGGMNVEEVRSDAAGKFALHRPLLPGHYSIMDLRSIPDDCFVQAIKLGGKEISWEDFEILSSAPMEIILSKRAGQIAGSVLDEDSKPFPASTVTLIPVDGKSRPQWVPVDDDGNFRITNLRPGKYQVFAWEEVDRDVWQDPAFRKSYENRATEVTVAPSETQNVQVRAIPASAATGR
jgi:hypothetical protein